MSCDVAGGSFNHSGFEENWQKATDNSHGELSALQDFNANFGNGTSIDPRMVLSNPPSPASSFHSVYNDQAFEANLSTDDFTYPDFGSPGFPSPYYDLQPVPTNSTPLRQVGHSAHFLGSHRRSVSEPPDNHPHHQPSHSAPSIGFHRDGHFIGTPVQSGSSARPLKSLPRNKDKIHRQTPYSPKRMDRGGAERYSLRRAQTQPMRQAPTSAPSTSIMEDMQASASCPPYEPVVPDHQPRFVSSRVCTPTPAATPTTETGGQIDPMLSIMSPAFDSSMAHVFPGQSRVSIPVTVDELQAMIVAAVEKAVKGVSGGDSAQVAVSDDSASQDVEDAQGLVAGVSGLVATNDDGEKAEGDESGHQEPMAGV
ncbi:hypothetical protein MBLNU230_g0044t1 [Neophaeotheca triangularis]